MKTETFITPRLILRRLRLEDAMQLHVNCSSDVKVARYLRRSPTLDPQKTKALVAGWIERYEIDDFFLWAVEYEGQVIGTVNLHDVCRDKKCCEIGFSIGSRWWKQGIMTEAAGAVIRYAFDKLDFERITGWCAAENLASARVMEKIGMRKENRARQTIQLGSGEYAGQVWYSVCKDDKERIYP